MLTRIAPPTYQNDVRPMPGTPIKWDSKHAQGLIYCWPCWEGAGRMGQDLVHGAHGVVLDAASPFQWGPSSIGQGFFRHLGSNDAFLTAMTRLVPLPMTFTCAVRVAQGAVQNPIFSHNAVASPSASGYRLLINATTSALRFTLAAVANYDATNCIVPAGRVCYVAVSATGNAGSVRFVLYDTVTGKTMADTPVAIGTMDIGPVPELFTLGGADSLANGNDPMWIADARVYSRAMSEQELLDLVNPASRWDLFSSGTFTRGTGLATITLDAPPLTFLELVPFNQSPVIQGAAPDLAFLELETFDVQETQSGFTTLGAVATPGATRGAVSG